MIGLTRTDGEHCRLDPDAVQRVEGHPSTVVHLTDGAKHGALESVADLVRAVREDRAAALAGAYRLTREPGTGTVPPWARGPLRPAAAPLREV